MNSQTYTSWRNGSGKSYRNNYRKPSNKQFWIKVSEKYTVDYLAKERVSMLEQKNYIRDVVMRLEGKEILITYFVDVCCRD